MEVKFTPSQQQIIDLRDCNILVSAAAGSGKTAVLVERILRRITDENNPVDIDRILVLTFTNAAAAEMKERIRTAIMKELEKNPESVHLQRQVTLIHNAQITTIHSFSLFLLRNHFQEIGLEPGFRKADEGEIKMLSADILEELFEEQYEKEDPAFLECLQRLSPKGRDEELAEMILELAKMAESYPWPLEWLEERKADYHLESPEDLWKGKLGAFAEAFLNNYLQGAMEFYKKAICLVHEPDGPYMYGEILEAELEALEGICRAKEISKKVAGLGGFAYKSLPAKKDDSVNKDKREQAKDYRDRAKKCVDKLKELFSNTPEDLAYRQSLEMDTAVQEILSLTIEYLQRMSAGKAEKKILEFSDMEHFALQILLRREDGKIVPTEVAKEYRAYFAEIMTDEYQDSNLVQEYLLDALSAEHEGRYDRFMVGDVKQSIYRFRLARPELFMEKQDTYLEKGPLRKIILSQNFRSRSEVINTVNAVFEQLMSRENGGIVYDEEAKLYCGAQSYPPYDGAKSELLLVRKPERDEEQTKLEAEAEAVAARIKELVKNQLVTQKDTGILRPAKYSDIAILLRSMAGYEETFKKVLEKNGIPVYAEASKGYFETIEIRELLNYLQVLDNPLQEIPLCGLLKSVFGGFTEDEIAALRSKAKDKNLYLALQEETELEKAVQLCNRIREYREAMVYLPIRELLERIVDEADYLNYITAMPMGAKRRANVEMLFTKASEYGKISYYGLFQFVRYIEKLEKYDEDFGEADLLDENADVVRLMTIHKSKGLEFPICIVAGLGKNINKMDGKKNLISDVDLGLAVNYFQPETRIKNKTLRHHLIVKKILADSMAEELRVLYVAFTRAKEKLILSAVVKEPEVELEQIMNQGHAVSYGEFVDATSYTDLLFPTLAACPINIQIVDALSRLEEETEESVQLLERRKLLAAKGADKELVQELGRRFSRQYSHENLQGLMAKTTVSELKIAAMSEKDEAAFHAFEDKEEDYVPAFRKKTGEVTGAQRGNAYHRTMELLDFDKVIRAVMKDENPNYEGFLKEMQENLLKEEVKKHLDELSKQGYLQEEYREIININKITHFILSPLGYRMWKAQGRGDLYREQPFVLGVAANRLNEKYPENEQVLIQGIIDVYFVEDNKVVLLDYKTDAVSSMDQLWNRYKTQLDYYTEALERLTGKEVSQAVLYSFSLEQYS